jgi:hypothetical protein
MSTRDSCYILAYSDWTSNLSKSPQSRDPVGVEPHRSSARIRVSGAPFRVVHREQSRDARHLTDLRWRINATHGCGNSITRLARPAVAPREFAWSFDVGIQTDVLGYALAWYDNANERARDSMKLGLKVSIFGNYSVLLSEAREPQWRS